MSKNIAALSCLILGTMLVSCTTTGDPTQGGIFWSAAKAKERQNALIQQVNESQAQVDALESKKASLIQQRNKLRSQIAELKASYQNTTNIAEAEQLRQRISTLEDQLEQLSSI